MRSSCWGSEAGIRRGGRGRTHALWSVGPCRRSVAFVRRVCMRSVSGCECAKHTACSLVYMSTTLLQLRWRPAAVSVAANMRWEYIVRPSLFCSLFCVFFVFCSLSIFFLFLVYQCILRYVTGGHDFLPRKYLFCNQHALVIIIGAIFPLNAVD